MLNLRPNASLDNFHVNDIILEPTSRSITIKKLAELDVLIIDEASMMPKELLQHAINMARQAGTKILFIGDSAQLGPVNEEVPPVFEGKLKEVKLTEVMRTAVENPLMDIFTRIRNNMNESNPIGQRQTAMTPAGIGVTYVAPKDMGTFYNTIAAYFTHPEVVNNENFDFVKVMAYSNKKVAQHNAQIRFKLFGAKSFEQQFIEGDILMGYANIGGKSIDDDPALINSMDYVVKDVNSIDYNGYAVHELTIADSQGLESTIRVLDGKDAASVEKYKKEYATLFMALEEAIKEHLKQQ
jgi:exodeoxyribonuclease-5